MFRSSAGRKLAAAALVGGGGAGLLGGSLVALLAAEAFLAKKTIGDPVGDPPRADGLYGGPGGAFVPYEPADSGAASTAATSTVSENPAHENHPTPESTATESTATESAEPTTGPSAENAPLTRTGGGDVDAAKPISFVLLGDSTACGYGVHTPAETPGALLATGLSALAGRPVRLTNVAVVGAETKHLDEQIDRALPAQPDVALIIIGANDVTHRTLPGDSVAQLVAGIKRLRDAGAEVVVGTCPDLGTVRPVAPPLRQILRGWSRWLAQAQLEAAPKAGARVVALGSLLGPEFDAAPRDLFGPDRFHPSAAGYASAAAAILPSLAAAAGCWPDDEDVEALGAGQLLAISFTDVRRKRSA